MIDKEATHGLSCPNCGGMVPIPEGQAVVRCPYCELRSFVRGERGLRRYQVPCQATRAGALDALRKFLSGNWAIARDASRQAQLEEAFLVYLPFWTVWSRAAAWAFGQKKVGSGDNQRYEPREVRVVQEMAWNGAACDVGEFGVSQVPLTDQALAPFEPEALHSAGMVFEPAGSFSEAKSTAEGQFQDQVRRKAGLDRLSQLFVRFFRRRSGLVYYPLWVLRYLYRGRHYQVVVDGSSGKVLFGKAPGNTAYRAAVLVAGMALGAMVAIDIPALLLSGSSDSEGAGGAALAVFVVGLGIMGAAYRAFRYGEQFEYRSGPKPGGRQKKSLEDLQGQFKMLPPALTQLKVKDLEQWIDRLS
jgi:DNA-directed RNA polymerase subunit RPC12/RpoP